MKEFDMQEVINFPIKLINKFIDGYYIVFAPEHPNWIVLNKIEYKLFSYLRKEKIITAMLKARDKDMIDEQLVIDSMESLLGKIDNVDFYGNAEIRSEESMNAITKSIQINLTSDCNLRCKHCYMSAGIEETKELNYNELSRFLDDCYTYIGKTEVVISGGEPLLYSNVFSVLEKCKNLGHKVILFSNGLLIDRNNIELIKEYVDEIQISMEGISEQGFESVRGKNTYRSLIKTLHLIKQNEINLTLAVTVMDSLIDDVEDNLIKFLDDISFDKLHVRINDQIEFKGNIVHNQEIHQWNKKNKNRLIEVASELKQKRYTYSKGKERNIHFSNCGIGTSIVINFDGTIYPCNEFGCFHYSIKSPVNEIIEGFNKINETTSLEYIEQCTTCELRYLCNGGCRIKNYNLTKSFVKPVCSPQVIKEKYRNLLFDYLAGE